MGKGYDEEGMGEDEPGRTGREREMKKARKVGRRKMREGKSDNDIRCVRERERKEREIS